MATKSDIIIKHSNQLEIIEYINNFFVFGKKSSLINTNPNLFKYYDTMVVTLDNDSDWTHIEYNPKHLYYFDEIIRRITAEFNTIAIFGYKQTTDETSRFAYFEKGQLLRSLAYEYYSSIGKLIQIDDFGKRFKFEKYDYEENKEKYEFNERFINYYDDIQHWYSEFGFEFNFEAELLHIEILKTKNQ